MALMRPEENMDWKYLLTSFEGRISRQPFWLSVLALFIAQWVIMIIARHGVWLFDDGRNGSQHDT